MSTPMRECWPWGYGYGFRIRNRFTPMAYLNRSLTTRQLLAYADMVRMAAYSFDPTLPGILVHRKGWSESLRDTWLRNTMWMRPYTKPHTFHELENPGVAGM
jgi:hypothetical protein